MARSEVAISLNGRNNQQVIEVFVVWIIQILAVGLLLVATRCFLHEKGIDVISRLRNLLHQSILVLAFLCMFVCSLVQYASNKLPPLSAPVRLGAGSAAALALFALAALPLIHKNGNRKPV